jgi:hypothetical protein
LKERVGIEVGFGHASFIGIDLLKFQVSSYSGLDQIDVGIYVTTTRRFQKHMAAQHQQKWDGSLTFEKIKSTSHTSRVRFRSQSMCLALTYSGVAQKTSVNSIRLSRALLELR